MATIRPVDAERMSLVIDRNFGIRTLERKPGPWRVSGETGGRTKALMRRKPRPTWRSFQAGSR
jgi:hypothetical protein